MFSKGKYYLKHIANGEVKQIRVWVKNIYKLEVVACATLRNKAEYVHGRFGEL